jgi:5-methyltetrahydrofolate--homocysteine methyltransferase
MNKKDFIKIVDNILLLDGATGTELEKRGMPKGICPEEWVLNNPEILFKLQREYIEAGSNAVLACTFGANRIKLSEFGLEDRVLEMNEKLVKLSKEAVGEKGLVAGDIAPTGQFIKPLGDYEFDEIVDVYKEQILGLLKGGVDFFVIETMMDIQETRAALLAVKESCDLPVCVSMTFNEDGRTLTGTDPKAAIITLQSLGADVVGCNCSTGPEGMLKIIEEISEVAKVPLFAKPNAGLPKLVGEDTVFDMPVKDFVSHANAFVDKGVACIGGCCGTNPLYIKALNEEIKDRKRVESENKNSYISSLRNIVQFGTNLPITVVGERINPTGKKKLQEALREGNLSYVLNLALEQEQKGANILDVNVGVSGIDEKEMMTKVVRSLSYKSELPLCIDSSSIDAIEGALRIYPGRALINSISAEKVKIEKLLPVASKYGAAFILLPLSDKGVPDSAEERINIVQEIYKEAAKYGYSKEDIVVDGLVMTVSSNQSAARETLKVISWCSNVFGVNTIIGLSNVSFGLPERNYINGAFLAMAAAQGLSMIIGNPSTDIIMNTKKASDVLTGKDQGSRLYIEYFTGDDTGKEKETAKEKSITEKIYDYVVKGNTDEIVSLIEEALKEGHASDVLVESYLIPAINYVGDLYEEKKYFLPQLIQSAEAMKNAFSYLEPRLKKDNEKDNKEKVKIIAATVKGDIHDIGKNIVVLMLKNYGFSVTDLGKDVSEEEIINKAKELDVQIIALSALMTTTMTEMKKVVSLAKKENIKAKIMVGGAVVTKEYADEIGADGYSQDAQKAVRLAEKLSK